MAVTTKAALADELGITRARVSQYVKAGLPVLADGKLDRKAALNWLKLNQHGLHDEDRGATRAARLAAAAAKPARKTKSLRLPAVADAAHAPSAEDEAARLALVWAYRLHAQIVATSVLEAGGSIEVAYAAAHIAHGPTIDNFLLVLRFLGHPDFQGEDPSLGLLETGLVEPDWPDLARRGSLTFDPVRCRAHLENHETWSADLEEDRRAFEADFTLADLVDGTPYGAP